MAVPDLFLVRHGPGRVPVLGLPRKRREPSLCPLVVGNRLEGGEGTWSGSREQTCRWAGWSASGLGGLGETS